MFGEIMIQEKDNDIVGSNFQENLKKAQWDDFCVLRGFLESYFSRIDDPDFWKRIAKQMNSTLKSCDDINFNSPESAHAYVIWHLLDRYHRFQLMQLELFKHGFLLFPQQNIRILDVGTGPAPALFAFSDFYHALNQIEGQERFCCREDYVEQSEEFRSFLHHFCELSYHNHTYSIPFHHGTFYDFSDISFEQTQMRSRGRPYKTKHLFEIAVFSSFFTSVDSLSKFKKSLSAVKRVMKNRGLIIITGACDPNNGKGEYPKIYKQCDKLLTGNFSNWKFKGYWQRVKKLKTDFSYNYGDPYGEEMRKFYQFTKEKFQYFNAWNDMDLKAQKKLEERISNTLDKIEQENQDGTSWKMIVYQKHVRLSLAYRARQLRLL